MQALSTVAERLGGGDFTVRTQAVGITEIDSVNESVNRTAVRLGDLVDRERAFSADASHQLRTPLTGLRLQLEAALDQPDADLRTAIGDALTTTDRLEATIDELLALARDTPGPMETLDVDAVLDGIRLRWHPVLAARGRPLRLAIIGTPHARVVASALTQILDVLIDNADRHGAGAITVTIRALDDAVAIDIADEGPPLQGDPSAMFQRRTEPTTGHGIGLALARRLAEAQGGRLRLATPDPPTFTLLLPAYPVASAPAGTRDDHEAQGGTVEGDGDLGEQGGQKFLTVPVVGGRVPVRRRAVLHRDDRRRRHRRLPARRGGHRDDHLHRRPLRPRAQRPPRYGDHFGHRPGAP